jgi:outer membrane protein insertion porin family
MGTVDNTTSWDDFRVSVGAGARVTVPMMGPVPIALDFAVPLRQENTDIKQLFSFFVGANW